jgi:hypothetical protein
MLSVKCLPIVGILQPSPLCSAAVIMFASARANTALKPICLAPLGNIEPRSCVKPELSELKVKLARFIRVRVARPFAALFSHEPVLRSRFQGAAPSPTR